MNDSLKTATSVVGLLAGLVAGVYVLGGLVIALRLLFDHFSFNSVVTILGQLPREPVVATALMDVIAPAVTAGLLMALYYAFRNRPRSREWRSDRLDKGCWNRFLRWLFLPFLAILCCLPAIYQALETDGFTPLLLTSAIGIAVTYGALAAGWYLKRRVGRQGWARLPRALVAGAIWAGIALTPAVMIASALPFESAQVCTNAGPVPQKGNLIGEGGNRVLLEQQFGDEAGVVALPADQVTRSEYGDLSSTFACPAPPAEQKLARAAEAGLGGHGGRHEVELATALRPQLLFDSAERWRPIGVESFVAERFSGEQTHRACSGEECEPVGGVETLRAGAGAPEYIDIHGTTESGPDFWSPRPECHRSRSAAVDCNGGPEAVIYYRRTTHEGRWYWDYWWFLRYNDYTGPFSKCNKHLCSDHEGDWEGITVVTTAAAEPEIVGAIYAAHNDRILVDGEALPRAGSHPLVFVAEGTHASYPFRCRADCEQYVKKAGVHLPEDSHDGAAAWGGNNDAKCARHRCVRAFPEAGESTDLSLPFAGAWAGWPGQWGRTCHEACNAPLAEIQGSPRSPGLQTRFKCPWAATRWAKPNPDRSGLSDSEAAGDSDRLLAFCAAQRGGL